MRTVGLLALLLLVANVAPASADELGFIGPDSGEWRAYRVTFDEPPLERLRLGFVQDDATCYNDQFGGDFYCVDGRTEGDCDVLSGCSDSDLLRRVRFADNVLDFAYYTPRSYNRCEDNPPPGRWGVQCGMFYFTPQIFGSFAPEDAGIVVTIETIGGGTVPEPASWALMIGGFGLVGGVLRRRGVAVAG